MITVQFLAKRSASRPLTLIVIRPQSWKVDEQQQESLVPCVKALFRMLRLLVGGGINVWIRIYAGILVEFFWELTIIPLRVSVTVCVETSFLDSMLFHITSAGVAGSMIGVIILLQNRTAVWGELLFALRCAITSKTSEACHCHCDGSWYWSGCIVWLLHINFNSFMFEIIWWQLDRVDSWLMVSQHILAVTFYFFLLRKRTFLMSFDEWSGWKTNHDSCA